MIQIKEGESRGWHRLVFVRRRRGTKTLLMTYMLRFHAAGQTIALQPLLCASHAEALAQARQGLELRPDCQSVAVLLGDAEIFHVDQAD